MTNQQCDKIKASIMRIYCKLVKDLAESIFVIKCIKPINNL